MIDRVHGPVSLIGVAPGAAAGALPWVLGFGGLLLVCGWVAWRFGPTLARYSGVALWWIGWCCGIGGGYGYAILFIACGTLSWGAGTAWYAARRGYWPSLVSRRIFTRMLGSREHPDALPALTVWSRRRRAG